MKAILKCLVNSHALADLSEYASKLSKEDIADYLRDKKLDHYVEAFKDNGVDGETLYGMVNDRDIGAANDILQLLGVEVKGDRLKIISTYKPWLKKKLGL